MKPLRAADVRRVVGAAGEALTAALETRSRRIEADMLNSAGSVSAEWYVETLWHYLQSGPGVFKGDLHFYKVDGDIRDKVDQIDGRTTPLYLLTGEYDYSCTTEGTLDVAKRTGAEAVIMKGLGHFPMSEDPPKFISYLLPVLEKIRGKA